MHSKELYVIVILLVIANIINIGADIGAMGAALNLLIGGPAHLYCALFALISVALQVRIPYKTYSRILKWLTFSLFAFAFLSQNTRMARDRYYGAGGWGHAVDFREMNIGIYPKSTAHNSNCFGFPVSRLRE